MSKTIQIENYSPDVFEDFDGTEIVITPTMVLFWKPPNPLGQWTRSPFVVDGVHYSCAEQFMMASKARLFGDATTERLILETDDPKQQKKLGKQVAGFNESLWETKRCEIVFQGNVAKFTQNEQLRSLLLDTGTRHLVEASPIDRIWGIGLAADNPDAYNQEQWQGLNLLGEVLGRVRDELKSRRSSE